MVVMLITIFITTENDYLVPYFMYAELLHLCPTLYDPMDRSPQGSSIHGILQARILEWFAISFSGDLPDPGIDPTSLKSPALASQFFTTSAT